MCVWPYYTAQTCGRHPARRRPCACATHHREAVADPESGPAARTVGHVDRLAVHGDHVGGQVAHDAPADVRDDVVLGDGHHRDRLGGRQPERLVIAARVVTHVVDVAEDERHRAEPLEAGAGPACRQEGHTHHPATHTAQSHHHAFLYSDMNDDCNDSHLGYWIFMENNPYRFTQLCITIYHAVLACN